MKREPLLIVAAAILLVVLGVDLAGLAENVERIVDAVAIVGGALVARGKVWPEQSVTREFEYAKAVGRAEAERQQP